MARQVIDNSGTGNSTGRRSERMLPTSHKNVKFQDGKYYVRASIAGKRYDGYLLSATTEDEAVTEFLKLKRTWETNPDAKTRSAKVKEIVPGYLKYQEKRFKNGNIAESTYQEAELTWRVYLMPFYGEKKISSITSKSLWQDFMENETRLKNFQNCRKVLVNFMNWAAEEDNGSLIGKVPKLELKAHVERKGRDLTVEEVSAVYNAFTDQDSKDLWELLYLSGRRRREIEDADFAQIDFKNKTFLSKIEVVRHSRTKPQVLGPVSDRFLDICRERFVKNQGSTKLFPHPDDKSQSVDRSYFKNRLKVAVARAGLNDIQWKDLRSTFANIVARKDIPKDLQVDYLGHSEDVNRANYMHKRIEEMRTVVNAVDSSALQRPAVGGNVVSLFRR